VSVEEKSGPGESRNLVQLYRTGTKLVVMGCRKSKKEVDCKDRVARTLSEHDDAYSSYYS